MKHWPLVVVFTIGVVGMMVAPLWRSGMIDKQGNLFFDGGATFYDAGVHLSLIGEMQSRFPPTNFAYNGVPLKNYHYFYDVLLAAIVKATQVSYLDLYYRYAPVGLSILLSLVIYLTTLTLTRNPWAAAFSIFFTVFATSFGRFTSRGTNNAFMTDQIYDMMVNPQGVLSLVVFLALFLLLERRHLAFFAILLALSFGFKAHGGVIFAIGAVLAAAWALGKRDMKAVVAIGCGLVGMVVWVILSLDKNAVGLQLAPFWLLEKMMEDSERLGFVRFYLKIQNWQREGNLLGLIALYGLASFIYLLGSIGLRAITLLLLVKNWRVWTTISVSRVFLLGGAATSLLIPILFNQGKKPFDVIQFTPYFTLLTGIGFTMVIFQFMNYWRFFWAKAGFLALLVILFLVLDIKELEARRVVSVRSPKDQMVVTGPTIAALNYIKRETPVQTIFVLAPTEANLGTLWFPALAWRRTVYSGEFFPFQVGLETVEARKRLQEIFSDEWVEPGFDYVFLRGSEVAEFGRIMEKYKLRPVFTNGEAMVLKRE